MLDNIQGDTQDLVLCTCSMPSDLPIFEQLCRSVDRFVDPDIRHLVIVPRGALADFQRFQSPRREIVAQEDVLPFRLYPLPRALRHLAFLRPSFRRPLYLTPQLKVVRGWILQQMLKIQVSATAQERAIMHVDSDVCFVRPFCAADAFRADKAHLFRILEYDSDQGREWTRAAAQMLGLDPASVPVTNYVENTLVWDTSVARDMVTHIETHHGRSVFEVLATFHRFSEYYIYGTFASQTGRLDQLWDSRTPFCHSLWFLDPTTAASRAEAIAGIQDHHVAVAVQSTHDVSVADREAFWTEAADVLAARVA